MHQPSWSNEDERREEEHKNAKMSQLRSWQREMDANHSEFFHSPSLHKDEMHHLLNRDVLSGILPRI